MMRLLRFADRRNLRILLQVTYTTLTPIVIIYTVIMPVQLLSKILYANQATAQVWIALWKRIQCSPPSLRPVTRVSDTRTSVCYTPYYYYLAVDFRIPSWTFRTYIIYICTLSDGLEPPQLSDHHTLPTTNGQSFRLPKIPYNYACVLSGFTTGLGIWDCTTNTDYCITTPPPSVSPNNWHFATCDR